MTDYDKLEQEADHLIQVDAPLFIHGSGKEFEYEEYLRSIASGAMDVEPEEGEDSPLLMALTTSGFPIITRAQWGARKPKSVSRVSSMEGVGVHWTATALGRFSHDRCYHLVRGIQNYHMDRRGWADIAYNLIPCPHGFFFEGRGVFVKSAANGTNASNNSHYATSWLGGPGDAFENDSKRAIRSSIIYLRKHGNAATGYRPHSFFKNTQCPGDEIRSWLNAGMPTDATPPAAKEGYSMLFYAKRGAPDKAAADAVHELSAAGVVSVNLNQAREQLSAGKPVIAVGGPAVRDLWPDVTSPGVHAKEHGSVAVLGSTGQETYGLLGQVWANGWKP